MLVTPDTSVDDRNRTRKALIVEWTGSAYDCLRGFLRIAARELAEEGVHVQTIAIGGSGWDGRLRQLLSTTGWSFALGMSGIGVEFHNSDGLLWEQAKIPFFTWYCDHPCY